MTSGFKCITLGLRFHHFLNYSFGKVEITVVLSSTLKTKCKTLPLNGKIVKVWSFFISIYCCERTVPIISYILGSFCLTGVSHGCFWMELNVSVSKQGSLIGTTKFSVNSRGRPHMRDVTRLDFFFFFQWQALLWWLTGPAKLGIQNGVYWVCKDFIK